MRTRRYSIKLQRVRKTIRVTVYADRSVEMDTVDHRDNNSVLRRPDHLQTRGEAAWVLDFARVSNDQPMVKEWL